MSIPYFSLSRWRERGGERAGRPLPLSLALSPQAGRGY